MFSGLDETIEPQYLVFFPTTLSRSKFRWFHSLLENLLRLSKNSGKKDETCVSYESFDGRVLILLPCDLGRANRVARDFHVCSY